jgi:NAD(P)-dependent dehydrogenase (short-subunit alcohol dehydrogenase family)
MRSARTPRCSRHPPRRRRRWKPWCARLAIELAQSGVTVNAVVPGFIRKDPGAHPAIDPDRLRRQTAAVPLGRVGLPDEVAAAIAFLASPAAGYIKPVRHCTSMAVW